MKKARGDSKLKTLPDALQEQLWQMLRRFTQVKVVAWLKETHGIKSTPSALSVFYDWYPRSATLRHAARTSQELEATLRKLPELKLTAQDAARVAQVNFEIQAAQDRDPKLYSALRKGELERARLDLEREKFEHEKKADWEKGLDALHEEIKSHAEALQHFEAMKAALKKARA